MLELEFMRLAFAAGAIVGVLAPAVGFFLVQRELSLIGDGIGHVAFAGVALGYLLGVSPVLTALAAAVIGAVSIEWLRARRRTAGDQALAIVFYTGIAAGVVLVSSRRRAERQPVPVPLRLDPDRHARRPRRDRACSALGALAVIAVLLRSLLAVSLDEESARVVGPAGAGAERRRRRARRADDRALDADRRDPPDRRADGAAGDRRAADRLEPALDDGDLDRDRPRLGARRADDVVLRRPPARRHDRARGERVLPRRERRRRVGADRRV